jgi:hypothetical protein
MRTPGPKTKEFVDELAKVADRRVIDHMIGVAESLAEDALDRGDIDEHMTWGYAFHTLRSAKHDQGE